MKSEFQDGPPVSVSKPWFSKKNK